MADFIWTESAGTSLNEKPRVLETKFGDGYAQRAPDGLNPLAQEWNARFVAVDNVLADEIMAFVRAQGGVTPFNYVPPWSSATLRFIAPEWSRSQPNEIGESDITIKFVQVFEP